MGAPWASVLVGACVCGVVRGARNESSTPHIAMVIVDDLGFGDVGYNNRELHAATPTLNTLRSVGRYLPLGRGPGGFGGHSSTGFRSVWIVASLGL